MPPDPDHGWPHDLDHPRPSGSPGDDPATALARQQEQQRERAAEQAREQAASTQQQAAPPQPPPNWGRPDFDHYPDWGDRRPDWQQQGVSPMAGFNWGQVGSALGSITTALTNAGVNASSIPGLATTIGGMLSTNPNESDELKLCGQILQYAFNPMFAGVEQQLELKLASEQGIPAAAAALVLSLAQPGVDIPSRIAQIEDIIRRGG